nr:copia protein [Tanacetum cinerariifolium]
MPWVILQKTRRNLGVKGTETIGFDKTKVECYNFHKRCHFARECKTTKYQDNKNREAPKRTMPVEDTISYALVSQYSQQSDKSKTGLGYDGQRVDSQVFENQVNDKCNSGKGYHAVPSPNIGKFMLPKPNLVFADEHVVRNKFFLTNYQEIDRGFVAFKESPKRGKIYGKGKIRTEKLDFEDVYFVKKLKFSLFFVSQMCDEKNSVLFTETECLVLSPNFKLLDENQVLLKVPRHNNMYSFDLKNVAPWYVCNYTYLLPTRSFLLFNTLFLDVKNAFLHGHLTETVYMHQPPGSDSAYSDYQTDSSLFIFHKGLNTAYLLLYVDDIILTASSTSLMQRIISLLHEKFAMTDLDPLNYFLGISAMRTTAGIFMSQTKYATKILKRAQMLNFNPCITSVDTEKKLGPEGSRITDPTLYRSLAGALQYLTFTRPDFSYAVQQGKTLEVGQEISVGLDNGYLVFLVA